MSEKQNQPYMESKPIYLWSKCTDSTGSLKINCLFFDLETDYPILLYFICYYIKISMCQFIRNMGCQECDNLIRGKYFFIIQWQVLWKVDLCMELPICIHRPLIAIFTYNVSCTVQYIMIAVHTPALHLQPHFLFPWLCLLN